MNDNLSKPIPMHIIGIMSGTSLDGIDIAYVRTDGNKVIDFYQCESFSFPNNIKKEIEALQKDFGDHLLVEQDYTMAVINAVNQFLENNNLQSSDIDLIGFHGQTIMHRPQQAITWQIGNPSLLAYKTNINVIADFRRLDMAASGNGAPLVPIFHKALVDKFNITHPVAIVNIGGIANISYIDHNQLIAFDTGPGNCMLDDLIKNSQMTNLNFDHDGQISSNGKVNFNIIRKLSNNEYFKKSPPKSLDRNQFNLDLLQDYTLEDAAATLSYFTAYTIKIAQEYFTHKPEEYIICGGGAYNNTILNHLKELTKTKISTFNDYNLDVNFVEAQAFAYLAARSYYNLPITYPTSTGVEMPLSGGGLYKKGK